jgi:alkylation response protein AidB-like acyl-CoA dehydrogenase
MAGPTGHDPGLWKLVASELGLPAVAVAEAHGGTGGSFVDAAVVLEEAGRALLPAPLLPTVVAAAAVDDVPLLTAVAAGAVATVAIGDPGRELRHVVDAGLADWFVIAAGDGLFVVPAGEGVRVEPRETLDPTRRQATVRVDAGVLRQVGDAAASARAVDLLRVALSVEAIGIARWCLETTVDYLKARVQFGRPIGSFQALQHRAADLLVLLESAASTAYYAAWAAAESPQELPIVAPLALSVCGDAAYRIAADTIQLHGGIGFTWEHDAHLYFKRATAARLLLGGSDEQRRLVARQVWGST